MSESFFLSPEDRIANGEKVPLGRTADDFAAELEADADHFGAKAVRISLNGPKTPIQLAPQIYEGVHRGTDPSRQPAIPVDRILADQPTQIKTPVTDTNEFVQRDTMIIPRIEERPPSDGQKAA